MKVAAVVQVYKEETEVLIVKAIPVLVAVCLRSSQWVSNDISRLHLQYTEHFAEGITD